MLEYPHGTFTVMVSRYNFQIPYTSSYFVLIYDDFESFQMHFNLLTQLRTFNLHSTFIIYLASPVENPKRTARDLFELLLKNYIYFALMALRLLDGRVKIYVLEFFYPALEVCYKDPLVTELETCIDGNLTTHKVIFDYYPLKPNFGNCSLDILTTKYPPFIIDERSGFEVDMLNMLEHVFNFSFNLILDGDDAGWGGKRKNGQWYGKLKDIKDNSIFGIGNLIVDADIAADLGYSQDYYVQKMRWVSPLPEIIPDYKVIFIIFKPYLWAAALFTYIALVMLFRWLSFGKNERQMYKQTGSLMIYVLGLYISMAIYKQPKTPIVRFLFVCGAFLSFILVAHYQTFLITFLTQDQFGTTVDTTNDVVTSDFHIGGLLQYSDIFENSSNADFQKCFEKYESYEDNRNNIKYWMKRVGSDKNTATILGTIYAKYAIASNDSNFCYPDGQAKVHVGKYEIYSFANRIISSKNNLLLKLFDNVIRVLVTNGFIIKWTDQHLTALERAEFLQRWEREKSGDDIVFTFENVEGAFFLLGVGYSLAIAAFIGEITLKKRKIGKKLKLIQRERQRRVFAKFYKNTIKSTKLY